MPTVSDAFPSKYLKAGEFSNRTIKVTIDKVIFEEIGQNKDKKPVMYFQKVQKGLVLMGGVARQYEPSASPQTFADLVRLATREPANQ